MFLANYVLMLNWTVWNRTGYLYKMDLALNNLQRSICHKTQLTILRTYIYIYIYIYIYMCVCVCVCELKRTYQQCMCLSTDWTSIEVSCVLCVDDAEFHEKLSSFKNSIYQFWYGHEHILLAVYSPIFGCCFAFELSRAMASLESWESWRLCGRTRKGERKSFCEWQIYTFPSHQTSSKLKIYFCEGQVPSGFQTRRRSWRHWYTNNLSNQIPKTTYFTNEV